MSYILDALRKADAQRERDPARGIHAQPVHASPPERPSHQNRLLLWGAAAIGAGLLAVAAWQLTGPAALPLAVPVAIPVATPIATPAAGLATAATPVVPMPLPATAVLPAAAPTPAVPAPTPLQLKRALALAAPAPPTAQAALDRVLSVNELPADVQRELPKMAISGGVYSANPAQRMLIVNGQVLGEGAEAAPGVLLEQIRARTAVLSFRGYRYGVAY